MSYFTGPTDDEGLNRQFGTEFCATCDNPCENCECCLLHSDPECDHKECN